MLTVGILLGYQLNLDSSMDKILVKRCEIALRLLLEEKIDKIIVSGGRPDSRIEKSEAEAMRDYLLSKGVKEELIIMEDQSKSTFQNAKYSVPIAKSMGAKRIIIVSTIEHFTAYEYNPLKIFSEFINDDDIDMIVYTNTKPIL